MIARQTSLFHGLEDVEVHEHEPMSAHTSFGIGGPADILAIPQTLAALRQVLAAVAEAQLPLLIIGNGTNIIVRDGGFRGVVVKLGEQLGRIRQEGTRIVAESGASLGRVCVFAADAGLAGLTWAAGIPGTIGGAVWMNAGASGGDMGHCVERLVAYDLAGGEVALEHDELDFSYRHSALQERALVVAEVTLKLEPGDPVALHRELCETIEQRCGKQPLKEPSAGCIFKRPPTDYAGRLIESVGGKGLTVGGAQISSKHAGFIVNTGGATANDVLELVQLVRQRVYDQHGIWLEQEVCVVGEE
ncbi:MAG: UDP-N-acetylmuramate dehydrogenase [Armatimonadia bacterium]